MARAIAAHDGETRPVDRTTEARAAAAVVARRLREALEKGAAMPFEREVAKGAMMLMYVSELLAELEGKWGK